MAKKQDIRQDRDMETLILQAAEREFMAKGFAGARTTSIAEAAGVTHAMFHYYFRTKEKLFERIMAEKVALLKEAVIGSVGDLSLPLDEIIRKLINSHLDFIAANPDLPRFILGEIYSEGAVTARGHTSSRSNASSQSATFLDGLHEAAPAFIVILQGKIDSEAAAGHCRKVDARMLMLDIVSLNVFAYMAAPAVNAALGDCMADAKAFLEQRKKENYDTITRKLRP